MTDLAAVLLTDLAADFIASIGDPRNPRTTARAYRDDLRQWLSFLEEEGVTRLGEVTKDALRAALAKVRAKGYAPETIRRRISTLRSFYRYLAVERDWPLNPALGLRRPKRSEPLPRAYEWATAEEILACIPAVTPLDLRNRCLLGIWLYGGLRLAETLALDWADIELEGAVIRARRTKGDRPRSVSFGQTLGELIRAWRATTHRPAGSAPVFVGRFGSRMDAKAVYAMIRRYGLYERWQFTPHRARHTHLTELLRRGTNIRTIQARAGHRDIRSSMVYLRVFDDDERRAGAVLG